MTSSNKPPRIDRETLPIFMFAVLAYGSVAALGWCMP